MVYYVSQVHFKCGVKTYTDGASAEQERRQKEKESKASAERKSPRPKKKSLGRAGPRGFKRRKKKIKPGSKGGQEEIQSVPRRARTPGRDADKRSKSNRVSTERYPEKRQDSKGHR